MDQNNKKNKPGGKNSNARGLMSLICWALILTIGVSYASNYMTSVGHQSSTVELYYSDMLDMAESGQLSEVTFDPNESIMHLVPVEGYVYTGEDGIDYTKTADGWSYSDSLGQTHTAELDPIVVELANDDLVKYLYEHGVDFKQSYQPPVSPLMAILVSYVLPFVIIMLTFSVLMHIMTKKGGMGGIGGIGGVGKANAKVYMEKQTGVTFRDVAGQDEAKESLTEIIDFLHNPGKYTEIGAKLP